MYCEILLILINLYYRPDSCCYWRPSPRYERPHVFVPSQSVAELSRFSHSYGSLLERHLRVVCLRIETSVYTEESWGGPPDPHLELICGAEMTGILTSAATVGGRPIHPPRTAWSGWQRAELSQTHFALQVRVQPGQRPLPPTRFTFVLQK